MEKKIFNNVFLYGTQFYRPPNPPAKERKRDLENIKKLGFNIIKIFAEWNWINFSEGKNDFSELIEIIEHAQKLNICVDINTRLEQAPYWVARKYPGSYYMDSKDRKMELQARSNTPTGGWPGLCFDHPGAKSEAEVFLANCARTLGNYENVIIFDCWNEPHIEPVDPTGSVGIGDFLFCYCPNTIKAYQSWLENKYGSIDEINKLWIKRYGSFEDIRPPRKLLDYVEMMQWRKFMTWSIAEQMNWRYRTLKKNLPEGKIVMSHSVSHGINTGYSLYGCDDYMLTENLDMFGLSLFPIWANSDAFDVCLDIEAARNMARGKTCINTELQGGVAICAPTGLSRSRIPERHHYRMWNFLDVAFGMKGIMYWHYRSEMLGHESPGFGLVKRDGSFTQRSDETSKICKFLNRYPELFNAIEPEVPEVAIIVNRDSYYLNFASGGDEKYSTDSIRGLHRFFVKNNIPVGILIDEQLSDKLKEYKVIYLLCPLVMNKATADALEEFVSNGGVILSDCAAGIFDKYGVSQDLIPSFGLDKVFGVEQDELRQFDIHNREDVVADFWPSHHKIDFQPPVYFEGCGMLKDNVLKMTSFLESYKVNSAESILKSGDEIVGTRNFYGQGKAYLFGTLVGQSLIYGDGDTEKTLERILESEGIKCKNKDELIIKNYYHGSLKQGVIIIINPGMNEVSQSIELTEELKFKEIYNDSFSYDFSNKKMVFKIQPEDACCIIYEKIKR